MNPRSSIFAIAVLLLANGAARAHHAFAPVYDGAKTVTVEGTVTEFRLVNPHALMTIDVVDESGNLVKWTVEFAGRLNLTVGGWTDDSITAGEHVTVTGNPTHTGSPRLYFTRLVRDDGSQLPPPGANRFDALEAERRQRREQRVVD